MVYADWLAVPAMRFYQGNEEKPANYHYRASGLCWRSSNSCLGNIADLASWRSVSGRIWFVTFPGLDTLRLSLSVESVVSGGTLTVYLIEDTESLINLYASDVELWSKVVYG